MTRVLQPVEQPGTGEVERPTDGLGLHEEETGPPLTIDRRPPVPDTDDAPVGRGGGDTVLLQGPVHASGPPLPYRPQGAGEGGHIGRVPSEQEDTKGGSRGEEDTGGRREFREHETVGGVGRRVEVAPAASPPVREGRVGAEDTPVASTARGRRESETLRGPTQVDTEGGPTPLGEDTLSVTSDEGPV